MRSLISLALFVLAGILIWHGIKSDPDARAEYDRQVNKVGASPDLDTLHKLYPYSNAAVAARKLTLENRVSKSAEASVPKKEDLKQVVFEIPDKTRAGLAGELPFVQPYAAAVIGLGALLLALILPRTRFRGLAFLGLLFGGAAALAGMLPIENQVALVQKVPLLKSVIASFPHIAEACVALGAITLAARVRRPAPAPAR
jgi:hypothetical protein